MWPALLALAGRIAYEQGELAPAERLLDASLAADPRCALCLGWRGMVEEEKRVGDGRPLYERALALAPNDPDLLQSYGESLLGAGELDRARAALDRALAVAPRAAGPHYLLAEIALRRGDRLAARREFRAHIALEPQSGAHHDLGDLAL